MEHIEPTEFINQIDTTTQEIIRWFLKRYCAESGCPVYSVAGTDGKSRDKRDLLSELGDYVPFFWVLGEQDFVNRQIDILHRRFKKTLAIFTKPQIRRFHGIGLPGKCRTRLPHVDSQDYVEILYGLLELYELSGTSRFLELAVEIFERVKKLFYRMGAIRTWHIMPFGPTLSLADALSGMYIEIAADLARLTGQAKYLEFAETLANFWIQTPLFQSFGIFPAMQIEWPWDRLPIFKRRLSRTFLAKENTSVAYGLFSLAGTPHHKEWALNALDLWITGLYNHFATKDLVLAHTPIFYATDQYGPVLSTNFAVVDLLCDMYRLKKEHRYIELAKGIADYFLRFQSPFTGLFPDQPGFSRSYIDGNTDIAVSMAKLSELTQIPSYRESGRKAVMGVITYHKCRYGFYREVDIETGAVIDNTVDTRFVSLFLKPLILYRDDRKIYDDSSYWSLFRDR